MLTKMFEEAGTLKDMSVPQQQIYMTLASIFQEDYENLMLDPRELTEHNGTGTIDLWRNLLSFPETIAYIKGQMAFLAQISQRKTFAALVTMALQGGQGASQAAKQVQEISGIMNQQDTNRTIVLHYIPRPKET